MTGLTCRRVLVAVLAGNLLLAGSVFADGRARDLVRYARPPQRYVVPVRGVTPQAIRSTWHAPRPNGRKHLGVDIPAPRGTDVVSATEGVVRKVGTDRLGGNVVKVLGEGMQIFYYAHLDSFAPGLKVGDRIHAGTVLGAVGNTGNARTTGPHLHFGVTRLSPLHLTRTRLDPAVLLRENGRLLKPLPGPRTQGVQGWLEGPAAGGEVIHHDHRPPATDFAHHDAGLLQFFQALGEEAVGNLRNPLADLAKARRTGHQDAKDRARPAPADELHGPVEERA